MANSGFTCVVFVTRSVEFHELVLTSFPVQSPTLIARVTWSLLSGLTNCNSLQTPTKSVTGLGKKICVYKIYPRWKLETRCEEHKEARRFKKKTSERAEFSRSRQFGKCLA